MDEPVRGGLPDPSFFSLPGIEQARAMQRGTIPRPPWHHLTGSVMTQVGPGTAVATMPASPAMQTMDGTIDFRGLLEATMGFAALTGAPGGSEVRPASITVSNLRPCTLESRLVVVRARTVHAGPSFTLAEVLVEDSAGRAVAHGVGSYLIRPLSPAPGAWTGSDGVVAGPAYPTPDPYLRPPVAPIRPELLEQMPFLEMCRRTIAGEMPTFPAHAQVGMHIAEVGEGECATVMRASEWLCLRTREVLPGALASMAHHTLGGAAGTLAPLGYRIGILDQTVKFLAPVPADGRQLTARARVTHRLDESVLCTAEISDADGRVVAVAHQSALLRPPRRSPSAAPPARRLTTVLFTDIVSSTEQAAAIGDTAWRALLDQHHAVVRRQLQLFDGREVKTTGDGFLATFDAPGQAVLCARAVREALLPLGLHIRAGVHTGECEVSGADVSGIAVHLAARVQGRADPGEILVSRTVHDLVAGSGLRFTDRGVHELKGIDGTWALFAVDS